MENYFIFIAIGITVITVPITTLLSLWVKWRWENPKIYGIITYKVKDSNKIKFLAPTWRRYKLKDLFYCGYLRKGSKESELHHAFKLSNLINVDYEFELCVPQKTNFSKQSRRLRQMIETSI